jgi:hypothetical protein
VLADHGGSFDMMIVPEAANTPPTPWQTEIRASGIWAGAVPAHLAHALLQCVHAGMHVGEAAAIAVERQLAAGGGVRSAMKAPASAARHKAQIFEAVDRQVRAKLAPGSEQGAS